MSLLLLDAERLIASVNGYTYCLDPLSGTQLWYNGLAGFGTGVDLDCGCGSAQSP